MMMMMTLFDMDFVFRRHRILSDCSFWSWIVSGHSANEFRLLVIWTHRTKLK